VGWGRRRGRRRRNRGRECQSMGIYWLLPMESPTERVCQYTRWWVCRWQCHVTVRRSRFESLGHPIGKIVWKKYTSSHRCNFPKKLYNPSGIRSVYTDELTLSVYTDRIADEYCLSVYTDRIGDGIIFVGKNYRRKNFIGNYVAFRRFFGSGWCVIS
jgi:hypothetical protein